MGLLAVVLNEKISNCAVVVQAVRSLLITMRCTTSMVAPVSVPTGLGAVMVPVVVTRVIQVPLKSGPVQFASGHVLQVPEQSLSLQLVQPDGQQPSPLTQVVIGV